MITIYSVKEKLNANTYNITSPTVICHFQIQTAHIVYFVINISWDLLCLLYHVHSLPSKVNIHILIYLNRAPGVKGQLG